jgi:hypothetical protein
MTRRQYLTMGLAPALLALFLLAGPAWAQNQGGAAAPPAQAGQLCTGGPGGTCSVKAPSPQGNQNCPGAASQKPEGKGPKRGCGVNKPNPQNRPATGQ